MKNFSFSCVLAMASALFHPSASSSFSHHHALENNDSRETADRMLRQEGLPPVLSKALVLHEAILHNINDDDDTNKQGECDDPPYGFQSLLNGIISTWTREERSAFSFVSEFYAPDVVMTVYLVYFAAGDDSSSSGGGGGHPPEAFYPDAKQGREYGRILRDLKSFWDVDGGDIEIFAFTLRDPELLKVAYTHALPFLEAVGFPSSFPSNNPDDLVNDVFEIFAQYPAIAGTDNPLWTGNAFAWDEEQFSGRGIAMGDGIVQLTEAAGIDSAGPDAILAHEYGHQVSSSTRCTLLRQVVRTRPCCWWWPILVLRRYFDLTLPYIQMHLAYGLEFEGTAPEVSRYFELLSDAFAGYFLHHPRGRSMEGTRVMEALLLFNSLGSCNFDSPNFHGTYNQRLLAAQFGMDLVQLMRGGATTTATSNKGEKKGKSAKSSSKRGEIQILTVEAFIEAFDAEYPSLVAADTV
jgi:hypothetical protein